MIILDFATYYTSRGLSVIPVKSDGSKSPAVTGWRKYSNEIPDDRTIAKWFCADSGFGIGVVPGPASGNLVILDFECVDGVSAYDDWLSRLPEDIRLEAMAIPTVKTPSGGRHIWVRLHAPQHGFKLARYASGKTKIEVRGEGHQVLAPGCPAECHASRVLYEWVDPDTDLNEFLPIDDALWAEFCEWACDCNEYRPPEQSRDGYTPSATSSGSPAGADAPGSDFNVRGSWAETGLFDAGWSWHRAIGDDKGFLTRPGKDRGVSASLGMVSSQKLGYPYLYVWSTSTDFVAEHPYSKFAVYATLKHGGDYSAAAKELSRLGYGDRPEMSQARNPSSPRVDLSNFCDANGVPIFKATKIINEGPPVDRPAEAEGPERIFKWMSELSEQAADARWIWEGYLARNGITLLSALWKSGKSTLLSHLLKSLDGSSDQFLGLPVVPSRVLYVTEEDESIWADRRNALIIGDHVGMISRPFTARPTMAEWKTFLESLKREVDRYHFDVVIFDTLSKLWPVRDENDAGQVEESLMPLWQLCQNDVAMLLVHHSRKSGGENFVGARGSGGLSAFTEILMEFGYYGQDQRDSKRIIKARGRYQRTPEEWLIELKNGAYTAHGDPQDANVQAMTHLLPFESDARGVMNDEFMTAEEVIEGVIEQRRARCRTDADRDGVRGVKRSDLTALLRKWFEEGEVEREGTGRRGDPYRYRLTQF